MADAGGAADNNGGLSLQIKNGSTHAQGCFLSG
jgi:hypothetical protein